LHEPADFDSIRQVSGPSHVLCLNAGSSSLKLAVYALGDGEALRCDGAVEGIASEHGRIWLRDAAGNVIVERAATVRDHSEGAARLLDSLGDEASALLAAGHRLVHGGPAPQRIDAALLAELRELLPLAPLHLPGALAAIEAVGRVLPTLPQVACFDTAFHHALPELAQRLPLPRLLFDEGVRRYGFHGLSYEYVVRSLGAELRARTVIAHLGSGVSLVALRDGVPIDTTMSFTPTGGVMMGTRSGDLDPGILLFLLREKGYDLARLARLVDQEAGLLGVSGSSAEMRTLLERRAHDPAAREAVAMFCYRIRCAIGALAAALGGLDLLVFTGAIGERSPEVRREIGSGLEHLGVRLAPRALGDRISTEEAPCAVRVVPTNENLMVARHTLAVVLAGESEGATAR